MTSSRRALFGAILASSMPMVAAAQSGGSVSAAPLEHSRVELPAGRHVVIRNRTVFVGPPPSWNLTVYIETPTPAADVAGVRQEATDLANVLPIAAYEAREGSPPSRVIVLVCRTQACVEMRGMPDELFTFVRDASGRWVLSGKS